MCDGTVQLAVAKVGADWPSPAISAITGELPAGAPYGSKASARAVSNTIRMTFGRLRLFTGWTGLSEEQPKLRVVTAAPRVSDHVVVAGPES
jgi:hypothetical protein